MSEAPDLPYESTEHGFVLVKIIKRGDDYIETRTALTNFTAEIVGDVLRDDGAERARYFELAARTNGRVARFTIPADQFPSVGRWSVEHLGMRAIVYPGAGAQEHTRVAIQMLSEAVGEQVVYAHTGWRQVDGEWLYLHAGGAIGRVLTGDDLTKLTSVQTDLEGELRHYRLPPPPAGDDLRAAVRASLALLDVAADKVAVPTLGAAYRAPLGPSDLSVFLIGPSGCFKTSFVAAAAAQHYGAEMHAGNLPGNYLSTGNALEDLAFRLKDCLFLVDDFCPGSHPAEANRMHAAAERLHRAQGNNAGRGRLRADLTRRPTRPPRGLVLSTGEELPRGYSNVGRIVVVEVTPGDVDAVALRGAQAEAGAGTYAAAMSGYLQWLASNHDGNQQLIKTLILEYVESLGRGPHARTAPNLSELAVGWSRFLDFASEVDAITVGEAEKTWDRIWRAITELGSAQQGYLRESEPAQRFLELIRSAIGSGRAHLADVGGDYPSSAETWGWRQETVGSGQYAEQRWRAQGARIGWVEDDHLYLEPTAALTIAQDLARLSTGCGLPSGRTLHKRLAERQYLVSTGQQAESRQTFLVRRQIEGRRADVLHLSATVVTGAGQSGQFATGTDTSSQTTNGTDSKENR